MEPMQRTVRYENVRSVNAAGFSLIELMVVVVIIGVIAGIAYPSYRNHLVKTNRAAAQAYITNLAAREEQVMLDNRGYVAATAATLANTPISLGVPPEVSRYYTMQVTIATVPPPTYTITATPLPGTMQANDGFMTLDTAGIKTRMISSVDHGW